MNVNEKISTIYKGTQIIDSVIKNNQTIYSMLKTLQGIPPFNFRSVGNKVIDYKIYGNTKQQLLPNEYQQVEYIENTGTQYINANLTLNQNSIIDTEFETTSTIANSKAIMGAFGGTTNSFYIYCAINKEIQLGYGNYANVQLNFLPNTRYKIKNNKNVFNVNGQDFTIGTLTNFTTGNFYVFNLSGGNYSGTPIRLYKLKIYDGQNLIRNFIPCYRKNDNEIGLYDLVSNTFFTNAGTGTFLKGNNAPAPNQPIEIKSVGEFTGTELLTSNLVQRNAYGIFFSDRLCFNQVARLEKNKTYIFETTLDLTRFRYASVLTKKSYPIESTDMLYDSGWKNDTKKFEFTTTQDCYLVMPLSKPSGNISPSEVDNYKFEVYEKGKKYAIPVKRNNVVANIYLNEPLRKIGNYQDYIDFETGKVHRKIWEENLSDTKYFNHYNKSSSYNGSYWLSSGNDNLGDKKRLRGSIYYCNYFSHVEDVTNFKKGTCYTGDGAFNLWLGDGNNYTTLESFKTWLSQNNVVADYILEDEIVENIELPEILTVKGNNTLDVDTTVLPSNMIIKYK